MKILSGNRTASKTRDMTEGVIWKHLILFALPLMAGSVFQQFYNTVDSIVVGNFVGSEALAAVTAVAPVINALIGMFTGLSMGAGVVISQYFGAGSRNGIRKSIHTSVCMTTLMGIFLMFFGYFVTPHMLNLMDTPAEVLPDATTYLHIYFLGILGLMLYNMGAAILRAIGDSRRPLYFLILSSMVNVVLDLLFVLVFRMGVAGVALATVFSQFTSAAIIFFILFRSSEVYSLTLSEMKMSPEILRKIFIIGVPAGLQSAIISFSNVFVQGYINRYGAASTAGWGIYGRVDAFAQLPLQSIQLAETTFVGQNAGAQRSDRIEQCVNVTMKLSVISMIVLSGLVELCAPFLVQLFNRDPSVVYYGTLYVRLNSCFDVLCVMNGTHASALRGIGDSKTPMIIMIGSFVVFRQIYLFAASHITSLIYPIAIAYPAGWLVCSLIMSWYFHHSGWKKTLESIDCRNV